MKVKTPSAGTEGRQASATGHDKLLRSRNKLLEDHKRG